MNEVFSVEECEEIIQYGLSLDKEIGALAGNTVDKNIRKGQVSWIENNQNTKWIFLRISDTIKKINTESWNFDLDYIENLQFTIYEETGDCFDQHIDLATNGDNYRKLSFSLQLSNSDDYSDCDLILNISKFDTYTIRNQGSLIMFPSFLLHRVSPITKGKRYSLVGWACGPKFR
jgi:PKHD-type hydroxylase